MVNPARVPCPAPSTEEPEPQPFAAPPRSDGFTKAPTTPGGPSRRTPTPPMGLCAVMKISEEHVSEPGLVVIDITAADEATATKPPRHSARCGSPASPPPPGTPLSPSAPTPTSAASPGTGGSYFGSGTG
ncbi:DUF6207 family protein [Streptomyces sioyaensis]|uniref:DUF6207 family protein n=1 Tax=Streptomyces sioyaensis TaxID=67364 RepID=UPI0036537E32